MRIDRSRLLALLVLVSLPLLYFFPAVSGRAVLAVDDSWTYSLPLRILTGQMLAQGTLPLWNPYTFGGMPLLAAIQPGVLYPPNWAFAFLSPAAAMNFLVITTYHFALAGTYLYLRALRASRVSALVAATAFTFGGFMINHLEQINFIAAAAWLPWLMWVLEKLYQSRTWRARWRWVTGGALIIAAHFFAGLPQATWHIILVSAAYVLFSLTLRADGALARAVRLRFSAAVLALAVCGALLTLIQLLPTIELQGQGERAAIPYEAFAAFPLAPRYWLTLIFPFFYGGGLPFYRVGGWDHWWLHKWACPYVGLLSLLLALSAWFAPRRARLIYFWTAVAVIAAVLSVGDHLPFGLNRLLYQIPIYNLFRGSYRHTYEFTFALAVLAGLGAQQLRQLDWPTARRALLGATLALAAVVAGVAMIYRFLPLRLGAANQPAPGANQLTNPEAIVPLLMFGLGALTLWWWARRPAPLMSAALLAVLLLDLASYGWFTYWRGTSRALIERLPDPPPVVAIKAREPEPHSFRLISYAPQPYNHNYELLNFGNITIARGLPSVSGYDPLRLSRPAALAGAMDIFGVIHELPVFSPAHQGLDLLNVKYLLRERGLPLDEKREPVLNHEDIPFSLSAGQTQLAPGQPASWDAYDTQADTLALVTTMTNAGLIPDETPVARLALHTRSGLIIERELRAGRDTAEWAYDRPDVRASAQHRRAPVIESFPAEASAFAGHRYLARLTFDRAEITNVELTYLLTQAELLIVRATLFDSVTKLALALDRPPLAPERWRLLENFGAVDLYENLRALPRAWFVSSALQLPRAEVLRAIKTGQLPNGAPFAAAEVALLEAEDAGGRALPALGRATDAEVEVVNYEPQRINLTTRNSQTGFLVLSEIFYLGWEARIDGVVTPVERADYTLRGIVVPPGAHRVEFTFRAPSFRAGALGCALGLLTLLAGGLAVRRKAHRGLSA